MRFAMKVAAAAAIAVVMLASYATAQAPPGIPNVPDIPNIPGAKVARFQMTIHGSQHSFFSFSYTLNPGSDCPGHADGQISEEWEFARGKEVVLEFMKLSRGGPVLLSRAGRPTGDAAFAATGALRRDANGHDELGLCGGTIDWREEEACGTEYKVNTDLRLGWSKGRLILDRGTKRQPKNPADACGKPKGGGAVDLFTWPYPLVAKQRADFSTAQIFNRSKRGFRLALKDNFIEPLREPVYERVEEKLQGESVVTLKRLRR